MQEITLAPGGCTDLFELVKPLLASCGATLSYDPPDASPTLAGLLASARRTGIVWMGPDPTAVPAGDAESAHQSPVVQLRSALGITSNLRPIRSLAGLPAVADRVDLLVVRETTEDIYAQLEHESIPGVFESLKVTTEAVCERHARHGFEIARATGRKKVTIVHKANIMKLSDGLFLRTAQRVAEEFPEIEVEDAIVDALCMKLVLHPEWFDVLLCGNLFGDIVADVCTGLVGGVSNAPSINLAPDCAVFTSGHPVSTEVANRDPLTVLLPAVSMLHHLGMSGCASRLRSAIEATLTGGMLPQRLGGSADAQEFCSAVNEAL